MILALSLALWVTASPGGALEAANRAFAEGDFDTALARTDDALAGSKDPNERSAIHLVRGRTFAALQQFDRVEQEFERALKENPEASLDPRFVLPTLVTLLDGVRDRLRGTLMVESQPAGAEITLDGKVMGPAPLKLTVAIGRHEVLATGPHGDARRETTVVRPRQSTFLVFELAPAAAEVSRAEDEKGDTQAGTQARIGIEARALLDPIEWVTPPGQPGLGGELGAVLSRGVLTGSLSLTLGGGVGFTLRAGARSGPVLGPVGFHASVDGLLFVAPFAPGVGATAGIDVVLRRSLDLFVEGAARYVWTGSFRSVYGLGVVGLRFTFN